MATTSFRTLAGMGMLDQFQAAFDGFCNSVAAVPAAVRTRVSTAAVEVLGNILEHGSTVGRPVEVEVEISILGGQLRVLVADDGADPHIDLTAVSMPDGGEESGRGLALVITLLNSVAFERVGSVNRWSLAADLAA